MERQRVPPLSGQHRPCPACGTAGLATFYELSGVPVQSNLLVPTRDEALAFPRGDLRLAFCGACGFITNTAFDPATQHLSAQYEATQGFSPTFNAFARSLADQWADRYQLAGKHALEIGCGRGEFIALLCQVAGCHGIGIDPVADPARPPPGAPPGLRLIADFYSERYADLPADFVCCRHTLEHVPAPADFVWTVRRALGERYDTPVCFEVPDTFRILRDGAFWDLYYEHCSYFTAGSLMLLFRECGFAPLDRVGREYDGQYLVIEAKPTPRPTPKLLAEDDFDLIEAYIEDFPNRCTRQLDRWWRVIDDAKARGRRLALWGAGSKAAGFLATLGLTDADLPHVVDINPHKQDTFMPVTAQRIVAPEALADDPPDIVIVMNPVYREEIGRDLRRLGLGGEVLTL